MTQLGELAAVGLVDEASDDKCPFCYKKRHDFESKKSNPNPKVVSKPAQLKCAPLPVLGTWTHTTAKHHLISAMQCYARVRRLVRMASLVDYDINDPPNGIGLPTVANNIKYAPHGGALQKFGAFNDADKRLIAFSVMRQSGAQWHVGHHAFQVEIPDNWAEELDESAGGHFASYDESVIVLLLKIMDNWAANGICDDLEDKSSKLIEDMDSISAEIRSKLNMFGGPAPLQSWPFFVSNLAFQYAVESQTPLEDEGEDDPAPVQVSKKAKTQ